VSGRRWLLSRDFAYVWWGQTVSQVGDGISKLALLWFVYAVTGSPLKTTVIGLLQTIPPIVLGPLIGVAVDRLPKKPLLIVSDISRAILIGLIPCWMSVESFTVERLYLLVFLHAVATALFGPALTASIPSIVAPAQYTAANALLQSTTSLGVLMGPALSGFGIAALSSQDVLCLNAVTYLVSALFFLRVRIAPPEATDKDHGQGVVRSTFSDLLDGIRFALFRQPTILFLTLTASLYTFATSAFTTLFPVFGRKLLDLGPIEVGYLWSAMGVGLLAVSIALIWISEWSLERRIRVITAASAMSGSCLLALVWVSNGYVAGALMCLIGGGLGTLTPIAWGVLQELSPPSMVGRALAVYSTGAMTAAIGGLTFFGWVASEFGEPTSLIGIGLVLLATAVVAATFSRWVRSDVAART
jgi:MFS family permease